MKIALINPPFLFPSKVEKILSHCLGLRYLSSVLKSKGHEVHFIDALMLGFSSVTRWHANGYKVGLEHDDILRNVPSNVDLIGISVPFTQLAPIAHEIVDRIKSHLKSVLVVLGGVYPSTQPQIALTSDADFVVVGEGEYALAKIAEGESLENTPGIYPRKSVAEDSFRPTRMIDDLDTIPFPDYSIPMIDRYFDLSPRMVRGRTASIITSRGCPFACEFCSIHPVYGRRWRTRSPENVLEEIRFLVKHHSIRSIEIEDDNFTLNRNRAAEILEGIVRLNERGANLSWRSPNGVRIDTLNEELIQLIKKSNCTEIVLGLEHGDQEMLKIMNKKLDLNKALHVIEKLIQHKIPKITLFIIVGYPGETEERFQRSLRYLKTIRKFSGNANIKVCVNIAQPYPGTKLLARCRAEGLITDDLFDNPLARKDLFSTWHFVTIETPDFSAKEVWRRRQILSDIFDSPPSWKRLLMRRLLPSGVRRQIRSMLGK